MATGTSEPAYSTMLTSPSRRAPRRVIRSAAPGPAPMKYTFMSTLLSCGAAHQQGGQVAHRIVGHQGADVVGQQFGRQAVATREGAVLGDIHVARQVKSSRQACASLHQVAMVVRLDLAAQCFRRVRARPEQRSLVA